MHGVAGAHAPLSPAPFHSAQEILPGAETQPKAGAGVGVGGGYRRSLLKKKKANATNATTTGTGRHLLKKKKANTTNTTPASTMGGH